MTVPNDLLKQPLAWRQPTFAPLLDDLQANILKGHGRPSIVQLLLRMPSAAATPLRAAIAALPVTSAHRQLADADAHRLNGTDGGPVVLLLLSHAGYAALNVAGARTPSGTAFIAGMAGRSGLADPAVGAWDEPYCGGVDAMVIIAAATPAEADAALLPLETALTAAGAVVVGREKGAALFRDGVGIEHFGYVDGRSQPLMLADEVDRELASQGETFVWDPAFGPLDAALVRDPGGTTDDSYGSYLVLRKLEQNVDGFMTAETDLADALQLMTPDARSVAEALVVGRFRDGTPLVAAKRAGGATTITNNFGYDGDPTGSRCPVHAHIRKANPRGGSVPLGATLAAERSHLMPRRGITYGGRAADLSDRPTADVGLLFMAYNNSIERQFEFTQGAWVDNPGFPRPSTGRDPVIGAGAAGHQWPQMWDDTTKGVLAFDFGRFVTLRGGGYFFAPSLSFLSGLAARPD